MSGPYKISVMFPAGKLGDHIRELATELALKRPQNWRVAEGHSEEGCPVLGLDLEDLLRLVELAKAEQREEAALPRSRYSFHDNLHEVTGSLIVDPVWLRDRTHPDTKNLIEHRKTVLLMDLGTSAAHGAAEVTEEQAPDGWCSPRAQVIGSLLEDLANGLTLESVTTRWNSKVDPLSYQRPQAAPSAGTVQQAEKLFETMGLADSLPRRFARLEEMEALWLPQGSSEPKEAGKGLFGDLATKQEAKASSRPVEPKAAPMTWEKFRKTVLPEALEMQVKTPGSRGNYVAFTAPVNGWAPPLLRWGSDNHRNPIGWYVYHGGSPTSGWALPVSEWVDVTTVCLLASAWGGRPSTDSSVTFLLKGCRDTRAKGIGSVLFPDTMRAELHGVRAVVEAYSKKHDLEPSGGEDACGLMLGGQGTSISVRVRSRLGWAVYILDRLD